MATLKLSFLFTGTLLASVFLPGFVWGGPLVRPERESVSTVADASEETPALQKLGRDRRSVAYYQQQPDFWDWYKYFMATHNQEGIENLDRMYMIYQQSNHKVEEGRSYNHYLNHLSEIYRACATSDDPECIAEFTSKPTARVAIPAPLRQASVKAASPAPILSPLLPLPLRAPLGYYYAPMMESFLSAEQSAELLRICNPSDVECLQYHLRAAYGYKPALSPAPSYSHLGCDPAKDPYCRPLLVARAPSGLYHPYPVPAAQVAGEASRERFCNPLFDKGCNPLSATKLGALTSPVLEYMPSDQQAPANLACDPRYDPYCLTGGVAALMRPLPLLPQLQTRSRLGVRGKTREGHDCYMFYDKDCIPVQPEGLQADGSPRCHPYDPSCGRVAPRASSSARDGVIEPHPDCDPEIDFNCRLRRSEHAADEGRAEEQRDEPIPQENGQEDPSPAHVTPEQPRFEDFLRAYTGHYKK
ncbi:actinodin2 [Brachyhypopomus gauderio]|uniref:actinodin2 n=1 Tax=Brachyhypopomus gauderio TaxID=698409 RepID=UPI004041D0A9